MNWLNAIMEEANPLASGANAKDLAEVEEIIKRSKIYANRIRAEKQNDTSFENVPFVSKNHKCIFSRSSFTVTIVLTKDFKRRKKIDITKLPRMWLRVHI